MNYELYKICYAKLPMDIMKAFLKIKNDKIVMI